MGNLFPSREKDSQLGKTFGWQPFPKLSHKRGKDGKTCCPKLSHKVGKPGKRLLVGKGVELGSQMALGSLKHLKKCSSTTGGAGLDPGSDVLLIEEMCFSHLCYGDVSD